MVSFAFLLFFVLFCHGVNSAQWSSSSPPDGQTVYACSGDNVTFAWQYILDAGDVVGDTEWLYDGHSQELIAIFSQGHFVPLPTFGQRVEVVGNAGITVRRVTVGGSGNYSVHVYADSGASHILLHRSVYLWVSADLLTTDGLLHAVQSSVVDPSTGQLSVQLQCGTFTFTDHPPFQVEWTTPSGLTVNSTNFSNGHFNLVLGNPVRDGTYLCSIPAQQGHSACLHDINSHPGQASVTVDMLETRLSLLEKENQQLRQQLTLTTSKLLQLNTTVTQDHGRLQHLLDAAQHRVAFHAHNLQSMNPPSGSPLIFSTVHYNEGDAYDNTTGNFTTPYSGVYMFIASTGAQSSVFSEHHYLYVDNTELSHAFNYPQSYFYSQSSVHAVVHLNAGQRVWVKTDGHYWSDMSSFSGFLLSHDI